MARMIIEWVAQVSLLRPGCSGLAPICEEKPRSHNRDLGHPLKVWRFAACFSTEKSWACRPTQGDEKRLLFSNYCPWKYALPFVISTGAQRSGEICGSAVLSWKCFSC
jgi:hypothetical protein